MGLSWLTMEVFKYMLEEEGSYAICSEPILSPSPSLTVRWLQFCMRKTSVWSTITTSSDERKSKS